MLLSSEGVKQQNVHNEYTQLEKVMIFTNCRENKLFPKLKAPIRRQF